MYNIIEDESIAGVIVRINSPGGSTTGSQLIYEELLRLKKIKPIIVSVGKMAASGGYFSALASDYIIADKTSLVGSIGVFFLKPDISGLLKKLGINYESISSTPLSDSDSIFRGLNADEIKNVKNFIDEFYTYFKGVVAESRKLSLEKINTLAEGKIYTGEEALLLGLVDEIGGYDVAIKKMKSLAKIPSDMEIEFVEFFRKKDLGSIMMNEDSSISGIMKVLMKDYSIKDFIQYRFIE